MVVYGCESWTVKKAECRRIDAFELWCWRRLLTVSWTARRSNQSIVKEISPEYSLEGLMLKLQYLGHLMRRTDSLEKTLMLGKIEDRRTRGKQRLHHISSAAQSCLTLYTARQASLSITNSRSSLRLTSIESVMPSSHLILGHPLLLLPLIPSRFRVFFIESLFASNGQSTGVSALATFLPKKSQG